MLINAREAVFERVELINKRGYFTELRVDRDTVPNGFYVYDIRDDGDGNICEVKDKVMVNHFGTVILTEELKEAEKGLQVDADDLNFLGGKLVSLPIN